MTQPIKAIETSYKGYRFRSRLEARWAVFFDALEINWEYEPEGFDLTEGRYLPDFFLPFPSPILVGREADIQSWTGWRNIQAYWLEIKPTAPSEREKALMLGLARETKHHVYCFAGESWPGDFEVFVATIRGIFFSSTDECFRFEKEMLELRREFGHPAARPPTFEQMTYNALYGFQSNLRSNGKLKEAFIAARSARFEHGERP